PYNMALSRRRAEAIEQGLVRRGLDRDHVTLIAYGEQRPRIATPNGMREPLNRRVEIVVGTGPSL
ncbi:MAG: OmpA family protein, partial [Rhodospirillales bacterium]